MCVPFLQRRAQGALKRAAQLRRELAQQQAESFARPSFVSITCSFLARHCVSVGFRAGSGVARCGRKLGTHREPQQELVAAQQDAARSAAKVRGHQLGAVLRRLPYNLNLRQGCADVNRVIPFRKCSAKVQPRSVP